jgi:hypothetical protein
VIRRRIDDDTDQSLVGSPNCEVSKTGSLNPTDPVLAGQAEAYSMDDYNMMTFRQTSLSQVRRTEDSRADLYRFDADSSK